MIIVCQTKDGCRGQNGLVHEIEAVGDEHESHEAHIDLAQDSTGQFLCSWTEIMLFLAVDGSHRSSKGWCFHLVDSRFDIHTDGNVASQVYGFWGMEY